MPKWPTFRKALLTDEAIERLKKMPSLIFTAVGTQIVRETANGGFHHSGQPNEYPIFSFERQIRMRDSEGKSKILYAICWVGGYGKGSIFHMGWQYPHVNDFPQEELENFSKLVYIDVAKAVHGDLAKADVDVRNFLVNHCGWVGK